MKNKKLKGEQIHSWLKKNYSILILFILSTAFWIYQSAKFWVWDFSSYLLNAQYWFSDGIYLEITRAPLTSIMLGLLHFISTWEFVSYLYIIVVSAIFAFSSVKLAEALKLKHKELFYALELTPFVLLVGMFAGTELLTLALLQLGVAYLSKVKSGLFLGLAGLARYTSLVYGALLLLKRKNLLLKIGAFAIPVGLWLLYNYIAYGNPLQSIYTAGVINITSRGYDFASIGSNFIVVLGIYLPFVILGLWLARKYNKEILTLVLAFTGLTVLSYLLIPHIEARYLFNLAMPVAFFSYLVFSKLSKGKLKAIILVAIVLVNFGLAFWFLPVTVGMPQSELDQFTDVGDKLECACASNQWVVFNSLGIACEPSPFIEESFDRYVDQGYRIVIFDRGEVPVYNYTQDMVLESTTEYTVYGNSTLCKEKPEKVIFLI